MRTAPQFFQLNFRASSPVRSIGAKLHANHRSRSRKLNLSRRKVWTHKICVYLCPPEFRSKVCCLPNNVISHEKDISTFSTQATKQARFPQAHVFCQRTQRLELTQSEGPQEVERKFGATPQGHRAISNAFHSAQRRPDRKKEPIGSFFCAYYLLTGPSASQTGA